MYVFDRFKESQKSPKSSEKSQKSTKKSQNVTKSHKKIFKLKVKHWKPFQSSFFFFNRENVAVLNEKQVLDMNLARKKSFGHEFSKKKKSDVTYVLSWELPLQLLSIRKNVEKTVIIQRSISMIMIVLKEILWMVRLGTTSKLWQPKK